MTSLYGPEHELDSWAHACEMWRRRAVAAEAQVEELRKALEVFIAAIDADGCPRGWGWPRSAPAPPLRGDDHGA